MKASSGTTCCGSVVDLSKLHPLDDERSQPTLSSQEWSPISTEQRRRSGYIDPVKVGTLLSSDLKLGKLEKANMASRVVLLGILFGVLIPVDMVPIKVSTKRKCFYRER